MLIVEFNGKAGCGKTTLTRQVAQQLKEKQISAGTRYEAFPQLKRSKSLVRCLKFFPAFFNPKNFRLNILVLSFTLDYGIDIYRLYKAISFIELNYLLDKIRVEKPFEVLLLDEGILQYLHYLPNDKEIKRNNNTEKLAQAIELKYMENIIINCSLDWGKNASRLAKRGPGHKRYAGLSDSVHRKRLETREGNLKILRQFMHHNPSIAIDMGEPVEQNADKITEAIK